MARARPVEVSEALLSIPAVSSVCASAGGIPGWVLRFGADAGRAPVNHKPVLERSCTARCLGWAPGGWSVCVRLCLCVAQRCRVWSGPCHDHGRAGGGGVLGSLTHSCRRVPVRGLGWSGVSAAIRA